MNEPSKQPIDPRKLAANAKVVVSPAPAPGKKVTIPAGKLQGLSTLPKPTDNPPPKPETIQGKQPTPPIPDTHPAKSPLPDTHQEPQSQEVKKFDENSVQDINETGKTTDNRSNLGEYLIKGGPGRPKKQDTADYWLEQEMNKPHGRLADGTVLTKKQMLAKILADKALDGNLKAVEVLYNRIDGKPMQKIQVVAPEDAEGTVLSAEAEAKLEELFGRGKK